MTTRERPRPTIRRWNNGGNWQEIGRLSSASCTTSTSAAYNSSTLPNCARRSGDPNPNPNPDFSYLGCNSSTCRLMKAGGRPAASLGKWSQSNYGGVAMRSSRRRFGVQASRVFEASETSEAETRDGQEHPLTLACRARCATALCLVRSFYSRVSRPGRRRDLQTVCLGGRQRRRSRDGTCGREGVLLHS